MNKQLSSLEALNDLREVKGWNDDELNKRLDIIEKALKDYERLKKLYKLEEETSKHLNDIVLLMNEEINKQLKALEIIKEKMVDVVYLYSSCYELEHYNVYAPFEIDDKDKLTQEEFDLLKEVLK